VVPLLLGIGVVKSPVGSLGLPRDGSEMGGRDVLHQDLAPLGRGRTVPKDGNQRDRPDRWHAHVDAGPMLALRDDDHFP